MRVLAEHPTRVGPDGRRLPVFCFQYVGAGKVLFHATDETWRWRYRVGDLYFARYWIQTIRYLCRSKLADAGRAATLTDRSPRIRPGRLRAIAGAVRRRASRPGRGRRRDDRGRAIRAEDASASQCTARPPAAAFSRACSISPRPGSYHAWIAVPALEGQSPAADFTVLPPPGEFAQVRMDAAEMRRAAEISGGRFYTFAAADRLLRRPAARPSGAHRIAAAASACGTAGRCWRCFSAC